MRRIFSDSMEVQERQIAHIIQLQHVLGKPFVEQEGWLPDYVLTSWGDKVSRVNIIGTVVDRNEQQLIIDDGTGTIPVRCFDPVEHFSTAKVGDVLTVVGKLRQYNAEQYIIAELIQVVESLFLHVRQKHLEKFSSFRQRRIAENQAIELDSIQEEINTSQTAVGQNTILSFIEETDTGEGILIADIIVAKGEDAQTQVDMLLMSGEIFEIKPGVVKVLK